MHVFDFPYGPNLLMEPKTWQHIVDGHGEQFRMKPGKILEVMTDAIHDPDRIYRIDTTYHTLTKQYRTLPRRKWILVHYKVMDDGGFVCTAHPYTDERKVSIIREGELVWRGQWFNRGAPLGSNN